MKEEKVTISILNWLEENGWTVVCFDFPQSGTGILLHPNSEVRGLTKNKGGIIPDILAVRNSIAVFFENKDRFVFSDFEKLRLVKLSGEFSESLAKVLLNFNIERIYYGIGIPSAKRYIQKSMENIENIDFLIGTSEDGFVTIEYDKYSVFPEGVS